MAVKKNWGDIYPTFVSGHPTWPKDESYGLDIFDEDGEYLIRCTEERLIEVLRSRDNHFLAPLGYQLTTIGELRLCPVWPRDIDTVDVTDKNISLSIDEAIRRYSEEV